MPHYDCNPQPPKSTSNFTDSEIFPNLLHSYFVTSNFLISTYFICSTLNLVLFICFFLNVKAYNSLLSHLHTAFPNITLVPRARTPVFTTFISPQSLSLTLGNCLIHRSVQSLFSKDLLLKKKNQLPSSIILKNQLISGIHDKTVLHLHSSYTDFNCLTYQGLLKRFQAAIPQLLSLHRKDTAEVTLQSIVSGFFP